MDKDDTKTVLIADDEEDVRVIVRHHLEKEGFNVITSENGEEAINALNDFNISLAITDLKMPKVDGFGVLDYIKTHCSYVPVIVLTGYIDTELVVTSMKKGAADYIPKPIKRDEFIDVVKNVLKERLPTKYLRPFEIVGFYLLNSAGVVIFHKDVPISPEFDKDIFGSMFTAVKTFIKDSFHPDGELRNIEHGSFKILIEEGNEFFLVVVGKGDITEPVRENMLRIVSRINDRYGEDIAHWKGDVDAFDGIEREFGVLTKELIKKDRKRIAGNFKKTGMVRDFESRFEHIKGRVSRKSGCN